MRELRRALVTGANRGIGLAVAEELSHRGLQVLVAARGHQDALRAARAIGPSAQAITLDVTDPTSIAANASMLGDIDVLVNNAGVLPGHDDALATDLESARRALDVNLLGSWRMTRQVLPGMTARARGRIVMISSGTASFGRGLYGDAAAYTVSKVAVNALTVLFADLTRGTGVLVNAVNPGRVRTRMMPSGQIEPSQASQIVADAALLPDDGPTGAFLDPQGRLSW